MYLKIRFGIAFVFGFATLYAQNPLVEHITVEHGLSQGMIFDILQSRDGFLWIATKDGLNRYDGSRFEVYLPDPFDPFSIGANEIRRIFEDSRGRLWLGYEGGLDVFLPGSGLFYHLPMSADPHFEGYVNAIVETPGGDVWVGCNGVLWKIKVDEAELQQAAVAQPRFSYTKVPLWSTPPKQGKNWPLSLICTGRGELLATYEQVLYGIEGDETDKPQAVALRSIDSGLSLIGESPSGTLYLNLPDGLWKLGREGHTPSQKVLGILAGKSWYMDREGKLWVHDGQTLYRWRLGDQGIELMQKLDFQHPFALTDVFYFTCLTIDHSGNAWMGASGYGLLKMHTAPPKFQSRLPSASQRQVVETPEGRLFSVQQGGLIYDDKNFGQARPNPWAAQMPAGESIAYAMFDKDGHCWARTFSHKLYRIDARTKTPREIDMKSTGLWIDRRGRMLSLTGQALLEYDPAARKTTTYPFGLPLKFQYNASDEHVLFYEDSGGVVWITAFEGLLKAMPHAGGYQFEHYINNPHDRNTLSNNFVLCVAEDPREPQRYLWIGTKGGGLNRLDRQTDRMAHFGLEHGLPDRVLYGILPDDRGHLWISTNNGLCRMAVEGGVPVFKNFTPADGLQSSEFNQSSFLKMKDGTLIFGGVNGLTVFHPDSLRFNKNVPQIRIVGLQVNNKKISQYPNINLPHNQNLLAFEFAALDLTNPAQNQYRYQLLRKQWFSKNGNGNWVELGHKNTVQFANLQPGSYTFKVMGSNNDGIWNETPAVFEFVIRPPWWAAWWAYLGYAAMLALALAAFYHFRLRRRMMEQEALRLRELDEFKTRFFTNISHEFRTPLTVILGTSEQLAVGGRELAAGGGHAGHGMGSGEEEVRFPKSKFQQQIGMIKRNGENLLRLINQILDLAKLENNSLKINYVQGDILAYLRYITESLHSLANARNVQLSVESRETEIIMDYDPEHILQIAYNLLSNAIKFTPSGGQVVMDIEILGYSDVKSGRSNSPISQSSNISISVKDTGIGIPPEDLPYIFDRFYQANNLGKTKAGASPKGASGTGIGLALTKELVNTMGGDISVVSEVGKGTAFMVRLPITHNAPEIDRTSSSQPVADAEPNAGANLKSPSKLTTEQASILLIEDNPDVMEYLAACLGEHYQLDFAYDGRIGIEKAIETVPDLIVSDVMMPEKDGFEVVQTLKNDERTSHIPIVLLTAKADVESRIIGLKRGADAYLAKPFHQEELLVTLANLLELRKKLQAKYAQPLTPHPLTPHPLLTPDPENVFLEKVKTAIVENLSDPGLNVDTLCRILAMSRPQLHRKLTALTGKNITHYIRALRLAKAKELLLRREMNVSEVAFAVGFDDPKYFSRVFAEEFGVAPSRIIR
jgi:signal transduction histidine kinase/CheY-like chemotaxis protein/AraC-like DNA-binding protein/ligand-binding sensor domain-containing protein